MPRILDRISAARGGAARSLTLTDWANNYAIFGGHQYGFGLNTTYGAQKAQEITQSLPGYTAALMGCPPAFAPQLVRALVLSQARFTFRVRPGSASARRTFGTPALAPLESPWPGATTGELMSRMEWHAGPAGNAFVWRDRAEGRLRLLRPDWTAILYGSDTEPDQATHALDSYVIGYVYWNGGPGTSRGRLLLPEDVAHWSPIPDPLQAGIGMSWLTPAIRDIQGDGLASAHKVKFFENGATPNLVVTGIPASNKKAFDDLVDMMENRHAGLTNAYRSLYLASGADAKVVGTDLSQIDFRATQGAGETRISSLSRVPASLLGISEGLSGSSLNEGNFTASRRVFADTWVLPTLQDMASCLSKLVEVPPGSELWFDTSDVPLLREDAKDAADIEAVKATTIRTYVDGGFTADSAVAAVKAQDIGLLVHSGLMSVQLQPPGSNTPTPATAKEAP